MRIRPARAADIEPALRVMGEAFGLPVRAPSVHTLVADAADGHLLVAEREGRIVGTGASVGFGATAWIGGVVVAPEARGERLGQRLTEAAIEAVGPRETILLLASAAGRPIYDRLGFEPEGRYRVFMAPPTAAPDRRALIPADRDGVRALDARVTGEDRALALDASVALATPDLAAIALRPPWPAHPILARDPQAGAALLRAVVEPSTRLAVPEENTAAIAAIRALGADEREPVTRMRRGPAIAWRPQELWGVFSLFFG